MNAAKRTEAEGDESLKRLGGGRWQTRDDRFTIEPQSGTWAVVDAEETDDLGLPLVRGPFRSLTDAKAAIVDARGGTQPTSPLAERIRERGGAGGRPGEEQQEKGEASSSRAAPTRKVAAPDRSTPPPKRERARPHGGEPVEGEDRPADQAAPRGRSKPQKAMRDPEPAEPTWFRDLSPADRGRARRLIQRLTAKDYPDPVSVVRRDLAGGVPALAAAAIQRRLSELSPDAGAAAIVALLADGRDDELDVRWRIVDGEGRPILVEPPKLRR
ncbi:MAG TPA: hypothetical protein VGO64_02715 [Candidatus Limnocylindrales bacterium]|nr:hypothetical protein [Candidatus Limnocylindrales bacterium]